MKGRFVMFCGKCGFKIENEQAHFCPKCGAPLSKPHPAHGPSQTSKVTELPHGTPQAPAKDHLVTAPAKRKHPVIRALIILMVLVAGCLGLVLSGKVSFLSDWFSLNAREAGPVWTPLPFATSETAETSSTAETATPAPTMTPVSSVPPVPTPTEISSDQVVLQGVPQGAIITINGVSAPVVTVGTNVAVQADLLTVPCQVRAIVPDGTGNYTTTVFFYEQTSGKNLDFSTLTWQNSNADGLAAPSSSVLTALARDYYRGFLTAINEQDLSDMTYSTAGNTADQAEHVSSDVNTQNRWDTETFICTVDENSIAVNGSTVLFNVTYTANRTETDTGKQAVNTNHRTIRAQWEDGMWKVDRIAFLSDPDFTARKYADLE